MKSYTVQFSECNSCIYARPGRNIGNEQFLYCEELKRKVSTGKFTTLIYTVVEIPSDCPLPDVKEN